MRRRHPRLPAPGTARRLRGGVAALALGCATLSGCARSEGKAPAAEPARAVAASASTAPAPAPSKAEGLPFHEDDYPAALAESRRTGRPIFVDFWATWCHSCLSLKRFVLPAPELRALASSFVWLSIDAERAENAKLVERLGVTVFPTLAVLDGANEKPRWVWKGTLTATELHDALKGQTATAARPSGPLDAADEAALRGDTKQAIALYTQALATELGARRPRVVDAYVSQLEDAKELDECTAVAAREGPKMPMGTHRVDVAIGAARCVIDAKKGSAAHGRSAAIASELRGLTASRDVAVLADDRSGAYEALVDLLRAQDDEAGARAAAAAWAAFLEGEAARAKSPAERVVFDAHRLGAYLALGDPARALPMLEASARDFPEDYNPPARMARALLELGRLGEAQAAAEKALTTCYGTRRLRVFLLKADIHKKAGDRKAEAATLDAALADAKTLRLRPSMARLVASIEARRRAL